MKAPVYKVLFLLFEINEYFGNMTVNQRVLSSSLRGGAQLDKAFTEM